MSIFKNFKSETSEYRNLGEVTDHPVRLVRAELTDSWTNFDGSEKENLPEYSDPTEQIVCIFVSKKGKGSIVHRFNSSGFVRFSELTKKQIATEKFTDIDGYACVVKGNDFVRIQDEEKTKACHAIFNHVFDAFGLPVGSTINDLNIAIEEKRVALLTVVQDEYNGKEQYRVARIRKARKAIATDDIF